MAQSLLVITAFGTLYLAGGPVYAVCTILILGSHEMGHYLTCRWYGVDCHAPLFPAGASPFLFGTFGAVIRMRPPIPSRRALFDIGIAGPIAGFVVAFPCSCSGRDVAGDSRFRPSRPACSSSATRSSSRS
jgi:membrane-associated protease RseP (regulator of RpoE activity)